MASIKVIVKRERGMWRGGNFFEGTSVHNVDKFTSAQLAKIRAEPMFEIVDIDDAPEPEIIPEEVPAKAAKKKAPIKKKGKV